MSIILDFRLPEQILPLFGEGFCYQQIEGTLGVCTGWRRFRTQAAPALICSRWRFPVFWRSRDRRWS